MKYTHSIFRVQLAPEQRIKSIRIVVCLALACGVGFSWRLWISSGRLFPPVPVITDLPPIPFPFDYLLLLLFLGALIASAIIVKSRVPLITVLIIATLLAILDQLRWQPWAYQYFVMLVAITYFRPRRGAETTANACMLILLSIYFWSGFEKLNAAFLKETWPDFSRPLFHWLLGMRTLPPVIGLTVPLMELTIAAGLLTRRFRNIAVVLALICHTAIMGLLIAARENTVVWPWNLTMMILVAVIFWNNKVSARKVFRIKGPVYAAIVILFVFLPFLNFIGEWDSYLSFALYSGNDYQAVIVVNSSYNSWLPVPLDAYVWQQSQPMFLDINRWAYGELNVPVNPEPRVFRRVAQTICGYGHNDPSLKLVIKDQPDLLSGQRATERYDCTHLH